ncbi:MAG: hypothetical protein HPY79_04990 [Bacteroidales bacterium]|nr:hypothetical protein [Bacteroidales bacterium]
MQKRFIDGILTILENFDFNTLEESAHSVYAISNNFELIYFNQAWFNFAKQNNGEPIISSKYKIGTNIFDGMTEIVSKYYFEKYQYILHTKKVWHHDYQCSSSNIYREYHQSVYPLKNNKGLVIINSLKVEKKIHDTYNTDYSYTQEDGFVVQCCNCRKTQRNSDKQIWDWVPAFVEKMPQNVSHSICPICFDYYYKKR